MSLQKEILENIKKKRQLKEGAFGYELKGVNDKTPATSHFIDVRKNERKVAELVGDGLMSQVSIALGNINEQIRDDIVSNGVSNLASSYTLNRDIHGSIEYIYNPKTGTLEFFVQT